MIVYISRVKRFKKYMIEKLSGLSEINCRYDFYQF